MTVSFPAISIMVPPSPPGVIFPNFFPRKTSLPPPIRPFKASDSGRREFPRPCPKNAFKRLVHGRFLLAIPSLFAAISPLFGIPLRSTPSKQVAGRPGFPCAFSGLPVAAGVNFSARNFKRRKKARGALYSRCKHVCVFTCKLVYPFGLLHSSVPRPPRQ